MAYVRRRGNQLAIVRGVRDAATGKVEQQILFTLYSKDEAREALGAGSRRLHDLLRERFPGVTLRWDSLKKGISENLDVLPERHERHARDAGRPGKDFRAALAAFTRELGFADPQRLASAAELVREHADELSFLQDLIGWRLKTSDSKPSEFTRDPFGWRLSLQGQGVPPDVEEIASNLYERGDHQRARSAFGLLLDAFGEDAETYNYLGLISLEEDRLDVACDHFEKASVIGRRAFPRKASKRRIEQDLDARPYVRALQNLALAQTQLGRYEAALATCERLDKECGDNLTANAHRATVALCTGDFETALKCAVLGRGIFPEESFVAAFAAHELGRTEEALASFLHGALSNRRAARMLLGERTPKPDSADDAQDHDGGRFLLRALRAYLEGRGKRTLAEFKKIRARPAVAEVLSEMEAVVRRWRGKRDGPSWDDAFDRMNRMRTLEFAREQAKRILAET